jgi:hypothetical protein
LSGWLLKQCCKEQLLQPTALKAAVVDGPEMEQLSHALDMDNLLIGVHALIVLGFALPLLYSWVFRRIKFPVPGMRTQSAPAARRQEPIPAQANGQDCQPKEERAVAAGKQEQQRSPEGLSKPSGIFLATQVHM